MLTSPCAHDPAAIRAMTSVITIPVATIRDMPFPCARYPSLNALIISGLAADHTRSHGPAR